MKTYLAEYCKFAIYRLRYGDPYAWGAIVALLAAAVVVGKLRGKRRAREERCEER
jgi:hypothetical protein